MNSLLFRLLVLAVCTGVSDAGSAATSVIWSIGEPDASHQELAGYGRYLDYSNEFPNDVRFVVGTSDPATSWPGVQPGPLDTWAGSRSHPYRIIFDLPNVEAGYYVLSVALVDTHQGHPGALEIEVNGAGKTVRLPQGAGDGTLTAPAKGKAFRVDLPFTSSLFKREKNSIRVATTESWVIWDSLRLLHMEQSAGAAVVPDSFSFEVLPLFKRQAGHLVQPARVTASLVRPAHRLIARVRAGGQTSEVGLGSDVLGVIKKEIDIPEITEPGELAVELRDGDRVLLSRSIRVRPSRKWTIHVVPQAHVDIGYTDLQERAMEVHRKSNDLAVELVEKYPEFFWSVESSYVLKDWLATRPQELIDRFFELSRSHRLETGAFYGNLLTGLLSDEEAFRSLYFSKRLSREYGSPFRSATLTDAPSHIWSIPTVLGKSGIRYLSMGINQTRAPLLRQGLDKRSPVWWKGPDGTRILAFFHDHYAWAGKIGLTDAWPGQYATDAGLAKAEERIPWLLSLYDRPDYPFDSIHLHGAYGDNRPLTEQLPQTARAWNEKYAYPRIVFSSNYDWFHSIEEKYGDTLETISGDGGAYWEDGAGSSASETAINRRNQQQALLAEMLLTGLHARGRITEDYRQELMDIWHLIMLYDEHTWGAHNSVAEPELPEVKEQFRYKARFAYDARERLKPLLDRARSLIGAPAPESTRNWELDGTKLRTRHYDITFDVERGGITSLIDRDMKRELIDDGAPYLCGQLVYARNEKPPYEISTSTGRGIRKREDGVVLSLHHPMLPEISMILRPGADGKRLDFEYQIEKRMTYEKEGIYIAFPFAFERPEIDYAVANAVVRAGRDWLPGACKDWFTLQNWLRIRDSRSSVLWVTLDAPLINLQDINSNKWLAELPITNGHVYAYIMNNYWFTNYRAGQSGHVSFRFSLTSADSISNAAAVRFGRDWSAAERAAITRMISVTPEDVIVSGFKRSENDAAGYIVRLREMSGRATTASLKVPALGTIKRAYLVNGVEDTVKELAVLDNVVSVPLGPWDVETLEIE